MAWNTGPDCLSKSNKKLRMLILAVVIIFNYFAEASFASFIPQEELNDKSLPADVNIAYLIWTGPDPTRAEKNGITLKVESDATFYTVMKNAASIDEKYQFETVNTTYGRYVTAISGYKEDPAKGLYWLLYSLDSQPNFKAPPSNLMLAPLGVDSLKVEAGKVYLFWLKKF